MPVANKRATMTLYTCPANIESHRTRMVLAEKDLAADIIEIGRHNEGIDLVDINPYNTMPTLVDRDLVLYKANIIMEYLDERFPHPPLLPVYPVARAKARLMIHRIEHDWYNLVNKIESGDKKEAEDARISLAKNLTELAPLFDNATYFMSEEFSLIDCTVAPILWRLPQMKINLSAQAKPVLAYAKKVFARPSFQKSLTETEREMRL